MNQLFEIIANLLSESNLSILFCKTFLFSIGFTAIYQKLKQVIDNFPVNYSLGLDKA
ncbi:MAG: hypothetical protein AAFR87_13420 [Bacteroidota bacterium]